MNLDWIQIPVLRISDSTMFSGGSLKATPLKINGWNTISEGLVQMMILCKWMIFRVSCFMLIFWGIDIYHLGKFGKLSSKVRNGRGIC